MLGYITFSSLAFVTRPLRGDLSILGFTCPLTTGPLCCIAGESFLWGFAPLLGRFTWLGALWKKGQIIQRQ